MGAAGLLVRDRIEVERRNKKKKRRRGPQMRVIDIRPNISAVELEGVGDSQTIIRITLDTVDGRGAKIREVLDAMAADFSTAVVVRANTRFDSTLELGPMALGKGDQVMEAFRAQAAASQNAANPR